MTGRIRMRQIDQVMTARLPRSRVVKDIHTNNLLPWYRANHPLVPIVYTVRHPIATALSRRRAAGFFGLGAYLETDLGRRDAEQSPAAKWLPIFDEHWSHSDELVRLVAEWCIENTYPLTWLDREGTDEVTMMFYETSVLDPVSELTRLAEFCSHALGTGASSGALSLDAVRRPSVKDWFGTAAGARNARDWSKALARWTSEVPAATTKRCVEVLKDFGMDRFYGEEPMPVREAASRFV